MTRQDSWSASGNCLATHRGNATNPRYAHFYSFTLGVDAEVTINLTSSTDTYLYLLSGHGTSGTVLHSDDDGGEARNSRLSVQLTAGNYTIEATTFRSRSQGSFNLTVATDIETSETAAPTVNGLAASYYATVGELLSISFSFEPPSATPSVESVSQTGLNLTLRNRRRNTVWMADTPTLAGDYTVKFTQPGLTDPHTTTINVTCPTGHTELSDRTCQVPCTQNFGSGQISSGVLRASGSWESGCLLPSGRRRGSGTYYAKHYTFNLLRDAEVTIDLTSDDQDTYLFLLHGNRASGPEAYHNDDRVNDDGSRSLDSRLSDLSLPAGHYTVSASTYYRERTGDFDVRATVCSSTEQSLSGTCHAYTAVPAAPGGGVCVPETLALSASVSWSWGSVDQAASYEVWFPHEHNVPTWQTTGVGRTFGPKDVVPGPRYEIYVSARNGLGAGPWTQIKCPHAAPSGVDQYAEVRKIAHISNGSDAYNMEQFRAEKFPSDVDHRVLAPYPYLTWRDDNCSLGPLDPVRGLIQAVTGFGDEYVPPLADLPLIGPPKAPFKHGCWRHDFAWRNLSRIEQNFPLVDSWNETNYRVTNARLKTDWDHACNHTYTGGYLVFRDGCRGTAALAHRIMVDNTSVDEYSSNPNDTGYFVR